MSENLSRVIFVLLMVSLSLILAKNVFGQKPEASLGKHPIPPVVGMNGKKAPPVVLDIYPRKSFAPLGKQSTLRIRLTVDRLDKNRAATLAWGSDLGNEGSTFIQLDGDQSPAVYTKFWEFPAGYYNFQACVYRNVKPEKVCVEREVEILGGEP